MISARWEALLLGLALVARIGAALAVGNGFHFADEAIYVDAARRLSQGGGFDSGYQQVPGYPVFLMLLSVGLPTTVLFLRLCQAAVAALGAILVFGLADRMFGRPIAIGAGLVYALDPLLVIGAGLLYPEAISALVLPAAVLLAWQGTDRDSLLRSGQAGALVGVLALLRPVALILPAVLVAAVALASAISPLRRLAHIGTLVLMFLLILAPWTARNYRVYGRLVPVAVAGTHTAPVSTTEVAREGLVVSMARWARYQPHRLVIRVADHFLQFWELAPTRLTTDDPAKREALHNQDSRLEVRPLFPRGLRDQVSAGSFFVELLLALVGIAALVRKRPRPALLMLSVILTWAVGYALFVAKLRYRIPILPLLFVFTGAGAAAVLSFVRGSRIGGRRLSQS
jgi:4-amino-4-deoxy-L-arabinose transferase-like glycosyltransferase